MFLTIPYGYPKVPLEVCLWPSAKFRSQTQEKISLVRSGVCPGGGSVLSHARQPEEGLARAGSF